MHRRDVISYFCLATTTNLLLSRITASKENSEYASQFEEILQKFADDSFLAESNRSYREAEFLPASSGLETAPINAVPSSTPISASAQALIIASEVSSEIVYSRKYQRPVWPNGKSGVTIGVGYDIGYATKSAFKRDWKDKLSEGDMKILMEACGAVAFEAKQLAESSEMQSVSINWETAKAQYIERMQPQYVGITERALKNFSSLGLNARGALVSLVYNRGPSFSIPASRDVVGRYEEMREIGRLMAEKKFASIPDQIKKMVRLWDVKKLPGLHERRYAEAALFRLDHS